MKLVNFDFFSSEGNIFDLKNWKGNLIAPTGRLCDIMVIWLYGLWSKTWDGVEWVIGWNWIHLRLL